jgi:hypothetical protein
MEVEVVQTSVAFTKQAAAPEEKENPRIVVQKGDIVCG